jgi:hypothetical protein
MRDDVTARRKSALDPNGTRCTDRHEKGALSSIEAARDSSPTRASDTALIASARAGQPEAWAAIFDAYHPPIYRYVRARIFEEPVAEDLAADVFLAALDGIKRYRYRGRPLLAWLYGIARNVIAEHQRQLARTGGLASQRPSPAPRAPPPAGDRHRPRSRARAGCALWDCPSPVPPPP